LLARAYARLDHVEFGRRPTALMKQKGWTFVDLAARWGVSVFWMSKLVNQPHSRPPMYDDAFRGLPMRAETEVVREARHKRKHWEPRNAAWSAEEMFPAGRVFEAIDSKIVEEGTRMFVQEVSRAGKDVVIKFRLAEGDAAGEDFDVGMDLAQCHFADLGLDHIEDVQR